MSRATLTESFPALPAASHSAEGTASLSPSKPDGQSSDSSPRCAPHAAHTPAVTGRPLLLITQPSPSLREHFSRVQIELAATAWQLDAQLAQLVLRVPASPPPLLFSFCASLMKLLLELQSQAHPVDAGWQLDVQAQLSDALLCHRSVNGSGCARLDVADAAELAVGSLALRLSRDDRVTAGVGGGDGGGAGGDVWGSEGGGQRHSPHLRAPPALGSLGPYPMDVPAAAGIYCDAAAAIARLPALSVLWQLAGTEQGGEPKVAALRLASGADAVELWLHPERLHSRTTGFPTRPFLPCEPPSHPRYAIHPPTHTHPCFPLHPVPHSATGFISCRASS